MAANVVYFVGMIFSIIVIPVYACADDDVFYYEYYVGRISYDGKYLTPFRVAARFCLVAGMLFVIESLMDLWWRTSRHVKRKRDQTAESQGPVELLERHSDGLIIFSFIP